MPAVKEDRMRLEARRAALFTDFARRCNAAQRAISLYPMHHPTRQSALAGFVQAADRIADGQPLSLTVRPDRILVNGQDSRTVDAAVTELATRLHGHRIGRINLRSSPDTQTWQAALTLMGRSPAEIQAEGGFVQLWRAAVEVARPGMPSSVEFQELDYRRILAGSGGSPATELEAMEATTGEQMSKGASASDEGGAGSGTPGTRTSVVRDVEELTDDPPARVHAWVATLDSEAVDRLDLQLLDDLLSIETDPARWREIAETAIGRVEDLHRGQDLSAGFELVRRIAAAVPRQPYADRALDRVARGAAMRDAVEALRSSGPDATVAKQLCELVGASVTPSLVSVYASARDVGTRRRVAELVSQFGRAGCQALLPLLRAPEADLRRTAACLLRGLDDSEDVSELLPLLTDSDPDVRREAVRSIMWSGAPEAHAGLVEALIDRTAKARCEELVIGELKISNEEQTTAACAHLASNLTTRRHLPIRLAAIAALGRGGGDRAVGILEKLLYRSTWWAPVHSHRTLSAAARALRRTGSPRGNDVLREAATAGPWAVRRAARDQMAQGETRS